MDNLLITIRHICFQSSLKEAALIEFGPGLNVVYGSSNTGKSSILDGIDFMFGRSRKLKEIDEHIGYEEIFLGLSFSDGSDFTLRRSISGGDFDMFEGLHFSYPEDVKPKTLKAKNSTAKFESLSDYLLKKVGLDDKKLKRNAKNQKERLTIRTLLPMFFATETSIQKEVSPFRSSQYTKETMEISRLKLLLTGVDDSALKDVGIIEREVISRTARVGMLEELIQDVDNKIEEVLSEGADKKDLEDQQTRIIATINRSDEILMQTEQNFLSLLEEKNSHQAKYTENLNRQREIEDMITRFSILLEHYDSDLARLDGIIEAGSLISAIEASNCPLCGATKNHFGFAHKCDSESFDVIESAKIEKAKIVRLEHDLRDTISQLNEEKVSVEASLIITRDDLDLSIGAISKLSPDLAQYRKRSSEYYAKLSKVSQTIELFKTKEELEEKLELASETPERPEKNKSDRVPSAALFQLAERVKKILSEWSLPNADQVHFDSDTTDIVLNGKQRVSNGKGHRAITHAAMTVGFATYLSEKSLPSLGFVVLDSPLLAYEEPDELDEISETNLNELFFESLSSKTKLQTIVFENKKSVPRNIDDFKNVTHFTKNAQLGRYGFFPVA